MSISALGTFGLTIVLELGIALLLGARTLWKQVLLVNCVTYPLFVVGTYLAPPTTAFAAGDQLSPLSLPTILGSELVITLVEAGLLAWGARIAFRRAALLALAMNATSFLIGSWIVAAMTGIPLWTM